LAAYGKQRKRAQLRYRDFIRSGKNQPSPWEKLKNQVFLGSSAFVEDMQCKLDPEQSLKDIPKLQKLSPQKSLSYFKKKYGERNESMAKAYLSGHYTLEAVGSYFGVSYATVSRAVKSLECKM
jgi:hypothetical protein